MKYLLFEVHFYSPYTSVPFYAEHGPGSVLPPPSTLIGALAAARYRPDERGMDGEFLSLVEYASFYAPPYTVAENALRHFTYLSQRPERLKALRAAVDAVLTGALDRRGLKAIENYGARGRSAEESVRKTLQLLFTPGVRSETYFWGPGYVLYVVGDGLDAPWIFRIGPKEAVVAATRLEPVSVRRIDAVRTRFYAPRRALEGDCALCRTVYMLSRPGGGPDDAEPYLIPPGAPEVYIEGRPAPGWAAVEIEAGGVRLEAVVPEHAAP